MVVGAFLIDPLSVFTFQPKILREKNKALYRLLIQWEWRGIK